MTLLSESEKQDFWAIVVNAGFSKENFVLREIEDEQNNIGIYAVTGSVLIERKITGISRQYVAGHATAWLSAFESDLHHQVFGAA